MHDDGTRYAFARGLDYDAIVATSERVTWTVDDIFQARLFNAIQPIVPAAWVATQKIPVLNVGDQLVLNQCRAFSYAHLLGHFEEFIAPHATAIAAQDWYDDRAHLRALFRFGDEELKHQQLFRRTETVLEQSCGYRFGRYFDGGKTRVRALTNALLGFSPLARFMIVLALEWGTQRHYVELIADQSRPAGDPLYLDVLKAHWIEEAQHTKTDALEIARLAETMSATELDAVFDEIAAMGTLVDAVLAAQAGAEVETLRRVRGRALAAGEEGALRNVLHRSLQRIFMGAGFRHPRFVKVAQELSAQGAARVGIGAKR